MLCLPSLIYLIYSFLGLIGSHNFLNLSLLSIIASILFILVWTWLLNLLCRKKLETLSWILLLLPLVLLIAAVAVSFEVSLYNTVKNSATKLPHLMKKRY